MKHHTQDYETEMQALVACVDEFASEMKKRLLNKYAEGWRGWDNPGLVNHRVLLSRVVINIVEYNYVDAAALLMFLWNAQPRK